MNAKKHGRYSAKSRELCALGRLQIRTADLMRAQMAAFESLASEDNRPVQIAEECLSRCRERLVKAALVLDRVLVERGDEDKRRRLVEHALQLTGGVTHRVRVILG